MSVVLLYHRVADLRQDPYGLAVHPDRFAAHVEHLVRLGSTVPLESTVGPEASSRGIAITFDDGYADNATAAAPVLVDAGLPATWFITVGFLGRRRFWWDRLADALLGAHPLPSSIDVEIAGRKIWLDLRTTTARHNALHFLHRRLLPMAQSTLQSTVDYIIGLLDAPGPTADDLTMTPDQLKCLAASPLQQVGAHTRTHVHLHGQSEDVQLEEILGSVADLSELLQRPVLDFAYPFGSHDTVGTVAPGLVEEAGCRLACTTTPGRVRRRSDPYRLPRLTVLDWDVDEFSARLETARNR
jgi:peptidoglycan/xylan/chitin deacetylase (PgdA/CDA1 family)